MKIRYRPSDFFDAPCVTAPHVLLRQLALCALPRHVARVCAAAAGCVRRLFGRKQSVAAPRVRALLVVHWRALSGSFYF